MSVVYFNIKVIFLLQGFLIFIVQCILDKKVFYRFILLKCLGQMTLILEYSSVQQMPNVLFSLNTLYTTVGVVSDTRTIRIAW